MFFMFVLGIFQKRNIAIFRGRIRKNESGEELPTITIRRKDDDKHRYQINDRDAHTGVIAKYNTAKGGRRKRVKTS